MEKPVNVKLPSKAKMILKLLPKSAAISFQSLPFSPGRDHKTHCNKGFSGPMVSIIPVEARRKSSSMDTHPQEPNSPKVSCIGQIKHKKKMSKQKRSSTSGEKTNNKKNYARSLTYNTTTHMEKPRPSSSVNNVIGKIFHGRRSTDASGDRSSSSQQDAPSLGQMKRFASGRETLSKFNWTAAQVGQRPKCYCSDDEYDPDEIIIPFSAPILPAGGRTLPPLEPRKEINLWKRRTMVQPKPLRLNN